MAVLRDYIGDTESRSDFLTGPMAYSDKGLLPSEAESLSEQDCRENGIPHSEQEIQAVCTLATEHGLEDSILLDFTDS